MMRKRSTAGRKHSFRGAIALRQCTQGEGKRLWTKLFEDWGETWKLLSLGKLAGYISKCWLIIAMYIQMQINNYERLPYEFSRVLKKHVGEHRCLCRRQEWHGCMSERVASCPELHNSRLHVLKTLRWRRSVRVGTCMRDSLKDWLNIQLCLH